jgi:hypothetical protein
MYGLMMLTAMLFALSSSLETSPWWSDVLDQVGAGSFVLIPLAIGIAILRHRLYESTASSTAPSVYGLLTVALATSYVAVVALLQRSLEPFTRGNALAVAGSTQVVAGLVGPARRRIQDFIDRRFYRSRFDARKMLDDFSARLRDEVNLEALVDDLLTVVDRSLKPAHTSLWLREAREGDVPDWL